MQQDQAFNVMKMGKNIFLTGEAGSGKTYLLNKYISYLKENNVVVAVTASTGIAATHLQGTTIHSWSGLGVRDTLTDKDLEKLADNARIKRNYKKTKVLIIDEISMLHKHQLDLVDTISRYILQNEEPFGGMQVILCGDFFQLPPISSSLKQFAYEGEAWERGGFNICYLHEQHRQGNDLLMTILSDIRNGTAGEHTKVPLRTRYKKEPEGTAKPTKLYSRNVNVDVINEGELANITGKEKTYTMTGNGFSALVEGLKKSCLAPEKLKLKIGAEVMFIKNDLMGKFVNGTRGVVIDFERIEGWPMVRTYDGDVVTAYPEEWKYEDNGVLRAVITQVPLRLAWAITIHKSQGMTLDAAEIDLGDAFEPGMGYVALSRVRSLSGLKLMNLNEMALRVHPRILEYDKTLKTQSLELVDWLQDLPEQEIEVAQRTTLVERFKGTTIKPVKPAKKDTRNKKVLTHLVTLEKLNEKLSIDTIAEQREFSVGTIIGHIEKLKGLKLIDLSQLAYLKDMLPSVDFEAIYAEFEQSIDGKITPIYEKFGGKYSFANIRVVRLFVE